MMLKITNRCSMGCTHCMNDAKCTGQDMSLHTIELAMSFIAKHEGPFLVVSGGEPTEHKDFMDAIRLMSNVCVYHPVFSPIFITITTNGLWLQDHYNDFISLEEEFKFSPLARDTRIIWQVTNDPRYYPKHLDLSNPVFQEDSVIVCDKVPQIYPQGRAVTNNIPWQAKASKCFNIRAITHQIADTILYGDFLLKDILLTMQSRGKFCTPHIDINGNIKLGESDLCPICSSIFKDEREIINDIYDFHCDKCRHINDKLPKEYKSLIGE